MPIDIQWDDEQKTIMHHIYTGDWTWTEFHQSFDHMETMLIGVHHSVSMLIDLSQTRILPKGSMVTQLRSGARKMPEQLLAVAVIGDNMFLQIIAKVMDSMPAQNIAKKRQFKICKSLDEARQWLRGLSAETTE